VTVGVHYPFDVLVGAMLGTAVGGVVAFAAMRTPIWSRKRE
jgi:membrane-associated phospholipid phosphatase